MAICLFSIILISREIPYMVLVILTPKLHICSKLNNFEICKYYFETLWNIFFISNGKYFLSWGTYISVLLCPYLQIICLNLPCV